MFWEENIYVRWEENSVLGFLAAKAEGSILSKENHEVHGVSPSSCLGFW